VLKDRASATARLIPLAHGEPIRFGPVGDDGLPSSGVVRRPDGTLGVAEVAAVGTGALVVHDAHHPDPSVQFALSRLDDPAMAHVPMGIFRDVTRPTYDDQVRGQVDAAAGIAGGTGTDDDIFALIAGKDTWTVA
jgi:2-oxoglutarate/2-oxoacid ferredoxin oxidoreductase subunit beta